MINQYFFTFGSDHFDNNGVSLRNRYVMIPAFSENEARTAMNDMRGNKWAFCYEGEYGLSIVEKHGIMRTDIAEVVLNEN